MTRPILILVVLVLLSAPAIAAPKAVPWERWEAHDPLSTANVDHSAWDRWLTAHVVAGTDGIARISYATVPDAAREALSEYIRGLEAAPVSRLNRAEQLAFWINLYNAATVRIVLDHYPVASIRDIDISPGLFADGPWGAKLLRVEQVDLSLDDIEHRILRPIWRDPRVHYAVNCASLGCPNLQPKAFTARTAETRLDRAAREFVNHPRGARIENGRLTASSIYDWFREDFGGTDFAVIEHLRQYAAGETGNVLNGIDRISGYAYDWSLNDLK